MVVSSVVCLWIGAYFIMHAKIRCDISRVKGRISDSAMTAAGFLRAQLLNLEDSLLVTNEESVERNVLSEPRTSRVLRSLPRDKAFYFFTSIGNYTGESSASLDEFVKKILKVNVKSLEFHLYRGDFERWIAGTLEDKDLAFKVKELKALKRIGMDLRDRLYLAVSKHFENLKKTNTTSVESSLMKPKNTSVTFWKPQPKGTVETKPQE